MVEILGFYRQPNGIWAHPKRQRAQPSQWNPIAITPVVTI